VNVAGVCFTGDGSHVQVIATDKSTPSVDGQAQLHFKLFYNRRANRCILLQNCNPGPFYFFSLIEGRIYCNEEESKIK
jgi:hypothetical protein